MFHHGLVKTKILNNYEEVWFIVVLCMINEEKRRTKYGLLIQEVVRKLPNFRRCYSFKKKKKTRKMKDFVY